MPKVKLTKGAVCLENKFSKKHISKHSPDLTSKQEGTHTR